VAQGLLALATGQLINERLTLRLMRRDNVATDKGRAQAAKALLDERRWQILRGDTRYDVAAARYDGLTPLETLLTADQLAELDRNFTPEAAT